MTDLTDRMRTCAAHILTQQTLDDFTTLHAVYRDAADLLIEASNLLEAAPAPLGEPMEVIPPVVALPSDTPITGAVWVGPGDTLPVARPYRSQNACPTCDSRAPKRVRRVGKSLVLICPVCGLTAGGKE